MNAENIVIVVGGSGVIACVLILVAVLLSGCGISEAITDGGPTPQETVNKCFNGHGGIADSINDKYGFEGVICEDGKVIYK